MSPAHAGNTRLCNTNLYANSVPSRISFQPLADEVDSATSQFPKKGNEELGLSFIIYKPMRKMSFHRFNRGYSGIIGRNELTWENEETQHGYF